MQMSSYVKKAKLIWKSLMSIIKESRNPYSPLCICVHLHKVLFQQKPTVFKPWWINALAGVFWVVTRTFSNHWRRRMIFSFCSWEIWPRGPFHYSVVLLAWRALWGITDTLLCADITIAVLITSVFNWEIWVPCSCISALHESKSGIFCAELWRIIM